MQLDVIHVGDAVEVMKSLPDESFGLIFTSPPYNLRNTSGGGVKNAGKGGAWLNAPLQKDGYSKHDDQMPHAEYVKWQRAVLTEGMRLLTPDGAFFYNHKWRVQKGLIQDRADIVDGFPVRQIIIWNRGSGFNFNHKFFCPTYEVIYVIAKFDFKLTKGATKHGDVWNMLPEKNNPHPAPFPLELAERVISSTSADVVLDPFIGSGTTAVAAKNLGRNFVGIDKSPEYVAMSYMRLHKEGLLIPGTATESTTAETP
jgi:site-specific DNA-methyltransferase (adenine-specific)